METIADSFRSRLSSEDFVTINRIKTFADLENAIRDIEAQQVLKKSIRNINKIRPFVVTLQQYTSVIDTFVNVKPDFLALIWGPIKLCLVLALKSTKALDALLDAYRKIGESMPIISKIDETFHSHQLVTQVVIDIYADILAFHERVVCFFRKKGWELLWRFVARTFESEFGDVVEKLNHSKRTLLDTANVIHMTDASNQRSLIEDHVQAQNLEAAQRQIRFVQDWLSAVDCDEVHEDLRQRRDAYPDTAAWIYHHEILQSWMNKKPDDNPVFWLSGILGAGKTVLFSSIVDHISECFPNSIGAYFYCNHGEESRNRSSEVLRSFLVQLISNGAATSVPVEYMYTKILSIKTPRSAPKRIYKEMVQEVLKFHDDPWIAIDGLDECEPDERKEILSLITDLVESRESDVGIRILIASREEGDIERSLQGSFHLKLTSLQLKSSIGIYIDQEARKLGRKWEFDNIELQNICTTVHNRTQGMFLLAVLIMENLYRQHTLADLWAELHPDIIPHGLEQAYCRIIARINKGDPKEVERIRFILGLLLVTKKTLQVHDIQGALAHNIRNSTINFKEHRLKNPWEYLKDNCGSILSITKNGYLSFVHSSTYSYLKDTSNGFIDITTARLRAASLCIANMSELLAGHKSHLVSLLPRVHRGDLAFLEYSVLHWLDHVRSLPEKDISVTSEIRRILKLSLEILKSENENYHPSDLAGYRVDLESDDRSVEGSWRLLGFALDAHNTSLAFGRCPQVLVETDPEAPPQSFPESSDMDTDTDSQLLPSSSPISDGLKRDKTPDQVSASLAKLATCRSAIEAAIDQPKASQEILLSAYGRRPFKCPVVACRRFEFGFSRSKERDSHMETHDRFKCEETRCDYSLLGFASRGALEIHNSLCHHNGSDLISFSHIQPQSIWKSLEIAIDKGDCLAVKELCIEAKCIPERPKGFLLRALQKKNPAAAHIIVQYLGDPEELRYQERGHPDALSFAAGYGDLDLFKKIMPSFRDEPKPLINSAMIAARENHESIVLIILEEHYAQILPYGLQQIIIAALKSGHENIVLLLLRHGSTRVDHTVLRSAIKYGRKPSIKEILQHVDIPKGHNWNDVRSALLKNVDDAVELCLKKNWKIGDVLADGSTVGNRLQHAAREGNLNEIEDLLGRGADINHADGSMGTAIAVAAFAKQTEVFRLLLDRGADINIRHKTHGSALQAASQKGNKEVVQLLLDHGADINAQGGDQGTALQEASTRGYKEIVEILLDHGADVNIQGVHHGTALQAASSAGHKGIVEILLDHGADVSIQGDYYGSVLQAASAGGYKEIVELLLGYGADVNAQDLNRGTALHEASLRGHQAIVEVVLDHGADVNIRGGNHGSALHAAVINRRQGIVEVLLNHGADINAQTGRYGSALEAASALGYKEIVEFLLDCGADVNIQGGHYGSALEAASVNGHKEIVELLLKSDADINFQGGSYDNALQAASWNGHEEIAELLRHHGAE